MRSNHTRALGGLALAAWLGASPAAADPDAAGLRQQLEALARQNRELQRQLDELRDEVREARDEARAARSRAERPARVAPDVAAAPADEAALLSRRLGPARLQLLDVSLDLLTAVGGSTASDDELEALQGGGHDPRQRGFTLQALELSMAGAVDPFFTAEAHLLYFLDTEGESRFELEEAFATSQRLPFGLEGQGLQVEAGQMLTEFGRLNPVHPHAWAWQDQPAVLTRLLGGDGARAPGARLGWLTPLPWFSELHFGVQNAAGENMPSFLASDEVFEERPIGGRPFDPGGVHGLADLVYLVRWVNGLDFGDEWSGQWGVSGLFGPNATGRDGRTSIAGTDLVLKWLPLDAERGWPRLSWQTELAYRWYAADDFVGCGGTAVDPACAPADVATLGSDTLRDWGVYSQLLWGFARGWEAGLRYEYAGGRGDDVAFDEASGSFVSVSRNDDPYRDDRHRVSPLLAFHPSEFSRLRLQYNYDRARHLPDDDAHSLWLGLEVLFGAHAAHAY